MKARNLQVEAKYDELPPPPPSDIEPHHRARFGGKAISAQDVKNSENFVNNLSKAKGKSEQELLESAMKLRQLTSNKTAARRLNKNSEAVKTLIQAIKEKPRFGKLVEYSVDCMTNLCVDDDTVSDLLEENVVIVLKDVMKVNPFQEKLQRACGRCIEKMAVTPAFAKRIVEEGGMDLLVTSLQNHHEEDTHAQNAVTLSKLLADDSSTAAFVDKGGLGAISKVMADNNDNAKIVTSIGHIVADISKDPEIARQTIKLGMLDAKIEALATFPESDGVVRSSIQYINNVLKADPKQLEDIKMKGVLDSAVAAMEMNPDAEEILDLGAELMNKISGENEVQQSIKAISADSQISSAAIAKIGNLALISEHAEFIVKNGGVQAISMVMKNARESSQNEDSAKVLETSIRAFGRLCSKPQHVQAVINQGAIDCVMGAMVDFQGYPEIIAEATMTLSKLTDTKEHCTEIAKKGGMKAAIANLQNYGDNHRIINATMEYIVQNARHCPVAITQFVQDGGVKQIAGMLNQYTDDPDMLLCMFNSLMGVLEASPDGVKVLVESDGLDRIVEVSNNQIENPKVVQAVLTVMDKVSSNEKYAMRVAQSEEICVSIFAAIEKHFENSDVQIVGSELVNKLTTKDDIGNIIANTNEISGQILRANDSQQQILGDQVTKNLQKMADLVQIPEQAKLLANKGVVDSVLSSFKTALRMKPGPAKDGIISAATTATVRLMADNLIEVSQVSYDIFKAILDHAVVCSGNEALGLKALLLAQELAQEDAVAAKMVNDNSIQKLVAISQYFPLNEAVMASTVVAIGRLCSGNKVAVHQVMEAGGHEVVINSAYSSMENPDNLLNALSAIATLSIDEQANEAILEAGTFDVLYKSLKRYPENIEVQEVVMEMFAGVLTTEERIKQVAEIGLIPMVVKSVVEHKDEEDLQKASLSLLTKMSSNRDCVAEMVAIDCSNSILAAAEANPDCLPIQDYAADLLTAFAENLEEEAVETQTFDEGKIEQGIENIKNATANIVNMEQDETIHVIEQLKALSSSKGAVWKLAHEGAFGTLTNILVKSVGKQAVIISCAEALIEMLEVVGEEVGCLENIDEVIITVTEMMLALEKFENTEPVIISSLVKHLCHISKVKENRKALVKKGMLDPIIKIWSTKSENVELMTRIAELLGSYAAEDVMCKSFQSENGIKNLVEAMRKYLDHEKFEQHAAYFLGTLSLQESLKPDLIRCGGIEAIAAIMERWFDSPSVVRSCNYFLANASFNNEEVVKRIVGCPVLSLLISSMDNHGDALDILESAATLISNICYASDAYKQVTAKMGAAKALVEVILRNYQHSSLLMAVFRAIGNLGFYLENVPIIIQEGAIQGIVAGMTAHLDDLELIQIALGVMTNLAADAKEENHAIMAQEGAVQAICEVAKVHSENPDIELAAISCLVNLAQQEYNADMVVRQGGLVGVVKTMREQGSNLDLMQTCVRLLCEVTKNEKLSQKIIKTAHCIEAVCNLIEKHNSDAAIVCDGLRALFHLASSKEHAEKVGKKGAVSTALRVGMRVVETRPKELPQLKEVIRTLTGLTKSEHMANNMAVESMALLNRSFQIYFRDNIFCEIALGFISNVCNFDSSADKVGATEIIPMIISTTKAKQEQKKVVLRGLRALENLAYPTEHIRVKLKKEGALLAIETIKKFWIKDTEIQQACTFAMDAIQNRRKRDQDNTGDASSNVRTRLVEAGAAKHEEKHLLSEKAKHMLIAGAMMTKHTEIGSSQTKHVFLSRELKKLCWRDSKKSNEEAEYFKISVINSINMGRCTAALRRKNAFGKAVSKEERSFACVTKDKDISLECSSEKERDEWVAALNQVKAIQKAEKAEKAEKKK